MKRSVQDKYQIARSNLLLMLLLTVVNIFLAIVGADIMLLFSATVPYFLIILGIYLESLAFIAGAVLILLIYLGCWYFSKKNYIPMIIALVMFVFDIIFMFWMYDWQFDVSILFDLLIHIWVLYYLITGVINGYKLKKEGNDETEVIVEEISEEEAYQSANETPLRIAEENEKARIFLEHDVLGKHVVYRRIKKVNELVINGKVYDEYEALVELPHSLLAKVGEHIIEVGFDGTHSYLSCDGELIVKKIRLI